MASTKKNLFSYSVSLKYINKTNPPTLRVNLIQNQSLGISERERKRESKRVLANLVVVVVVLNWVFIALFCKHFDFLREKKDCIFLSPYRGRTHTLVNVYIFLYN